MKIPMTGNRLLAIYSGVLTVAVAVALLTGAARPQASKAATARFESIDVGRINIVEPDGTPRLILSNKALFPGIIFKNKEYPHPNRTTGGILFFNDEGTENGGMTFGGETDKDGKVSAYGHLSFDQYDQDQVLNLDASEEAGQRTRSFSIWDRPDYSILELIELTGRIKSLPEDQQKAEVTKFLAGRERPQPRLFLGRNADGSVSLRLRDKKGKERLVLEVTADGAPLVRFLDENGRETGRLPAPQEKK